MEDPEYHAKTSAFLAWLSQAGVQMNPKIQVADFRQDGRGRGVVAVADLQEDEVVFSIPRSAVLNLNTALPSIPDKSTREAIQAMPSWLALTTLILSESLRADSKWTPYLAILPHELETLVFWSDAELAELQASTVVSKIGKEGAEQQFSQHIAPLGLENCDLQLCHKVASIIQAYAFDIPEEVSDSSGGDGAPSREEDLVSDDGEDEKIILSMIPMADMLNADAERNNARLCCDNVDLEMRTIKPIAKGEEILNDYGQLPRSDLLRRYGYVTEQYAAYDVAEIPADLIKDVFCKPGAFSTLIAHFVFPLSVEEYEKRAKLASREGVLDESYDIAHAGLDGPCIPDELLAFVFLLLIDAETQDRIISSQSSLPSRSKLTTELVGQVLVILLQVREQQYATSLEEDEKTISQQERLSKRTAMAIEVRLGEKKVLRAAMAEARSFAASNKIMRIQELTATEMGKKKRGLEESTGSSKKGRFR